MQVIAPSGMDSTLKVCMRGGQAVGKDVGQRRNAVNERLERAA